MRFPVVALLAILPTLLVGCQQAAVEQPPQQSAFESEQRKLETARERPVEAELVHKEFAEQDQRRMEAAKREAERGQRHAEAEAEQREAEQSRLDRKKEIAKARAANDKLLRESKIIRDRLIAGQEAKVRAQEQKLKLRQATVGQTQSGISESDKILQKIKQRNADEKQQQMDADDLATRRYYEQKEKYDREREKEMQKYLNGYSDDYPRN